LVWTFTFLAHILTKYKLFRPLKLEWAKFLAEFGLKFFGMSQIFFYSLNLTSSKSYKKVIPCCKKKLPWTYLVITILVLHKANKVWKKKWKSKMPKMAHFQSRVLVCSKVNVIFLLMCYSSLLLMWLTTLFPFWDYTPIQYIRIKIWLMKKFFEILYFWIFENVDFWYFGFLEVWISENFYFWIIFIFKI